MNEEKLRKCLDNYLECEELLNKLFKKINLCPSFCNYNHCCRVDMWKYDDFDAYYYLHKERVEKYGNPPEDWLDSFKGKCWYLKKDGCALQTHKPVWCLSHICFEKQIKINYDKNEVQDKLIKIIRNMMPEEETHLFKEKIKKFIKKI